MKYAPHTFFSCTLNLPVKVYVNGKHDPDVYEWDDELFIDRHEDWYALSSPQLRNKRVRVVTRDDWSTASLLAIR